MTTVALRRTAYLGAGLTLLNTLVSVSADAIAKMLSGGYAAPQLMALAGMITVSLGLAAAAAGHARPVLHTGAPRLVALRSALGAVSTVCFFLALGWLPFAQIFLFMAIMPMMGALLSALLFREPLPRDVWLALGLGLLGMTFLFPDGLATLTTGHWIGFAASASGSASIVLSRRICRSHTHSMAQVFYAQLACLVLGLLFLPGVWKPMALADAGLLVGYTLFLVATRWLMVVILRLLPAHVVMQIGNVQFLWMVLLGEQLFGETTGLNVWLGAGLLIGSGVWLVQSQQRARAAPAPVHLIATPGTDSRPGPRQPALDRHAELAEA